MALEDWAPANGGDDPYGDPAVCAEMHAVLREHENGTFHVVPATGPALAAFLTACGDDPDTDRLSWLSALLAEVEERGLALHSVDPDAAYTAIRESRELLNDLQAARKMARGEA